MAAPSLAHGRETGTGPVDVPTMDDEKEMEFDWDWELPFSDRARQALEFRRIAMEKYGNAGQPPCRWRRARYLSPSWRAMRGTLGSSRSRSTPACTAGRAVLRTSSDEHGVEIVGGHRTG